ncbi:hypothetical protein L1049_010076 [Liquidambar formosana]|uniref:DUF1771 domain-containing protein n=1 Tax=Liquidambar formosana TaxID=63359 RepID=A0AAP0R405_LIQFO
MQIWLAKFCTDLQGSTSSSSTYASNSEAKGEESSESSYGNISENSSHAYGNSKAKQKRRPASVGTVSCVLGKDYIRPTPLATGFSIRTKPLKLDSKELSESEIWGEEAKSDLAKDDGMHKDIEEFLFKLLGDGFQMDRDLIRDVLVHCGYDMQKSMEKLLDLSAATLDKRKGYLGESTEKFTDFYPKSESLSCQSKLLHTENYGSNGNRVLNTNGIEVPRQQKEINDLEKEVLAALFNAPERLEEFPEKTLATRAMTRSRAVGEVVVEPLEDPTVEHKIDAMYLQKSNVDDVHEEDNYQVLRRAVEEYRVTMKEYYKAAVNAFAEGDRVRAGKLLEQGHFFHRKAREADEESAQKIFETRDVETQDVLSLDLHDHGAKEAIRLLKCHLSSLSGIHSIKYLKVVMETNDEDITKGARKRRIMKLLEKESIKWIEEGNAGTILVCLDKINPKRLSFATKSTL